MSKLAIFAHMYAKPGKFEFVRAELEKLIPITRADEGGWQNNMENQHTWNDVVIRVQPIQ